MNDLNLDCKTFKSSWNNEINILQYERKSVWNPESVKIGKTTNIALFCIPELGTDVSQKYADKKSSGCKIAISPPQ